MYYEVYVDILFAENLWMNAALLWLTAKMEGVPARGRRILLAAGLGSLGACAATLASVWLPGPVYLGGTFLLAAGMSMVGLPDRRRIWPGLIFLYLEGFLLSGILRYVELFHPLSGMGILFCGSAVVLLASVGVQSWRAGRAKRELTGMATLCLGEHQMSVEAYLDTGNTLCDPVNGEPVSILSETLMQELLTGSEREILPHMIPYHTISQSGLLKAYRLDSMELQFPSGNQNWENPLIACMPQESGQYSLILHRDLLPS